MFADDNIKPDENVRKFSKRIEKTVAKGEIGRYEQYLLFLQCFQKTLKCNSSPEKHVFFYLFPDCLCIIIHFSAYPTTIRARVLSLFAQVCKRKNPISEPRLDLAVILVTSRYEHNTLPVNSEQ